MRRHWCRPYQVCLSSTGTAHHSFFSLENSFKARMLTNCFSHAQINNQGKEKNPGVSVFPICLILVHLHTRPSSPEGCHEEIQVDGGSASLFKPTLSPCHLWTCVTDIEADRRALHLLSAAAEFSDWLHCCAVSTDRTGRHPFSDSKHWTVMSKQCCAVSFGWAVLWCLLFVLQVQPIAPSPPLHAGRPCLYGWHHLYYILSQYWDLQLPQTTSR